VLQCGIVDYDAAELQLGFVLGAVYYNVLQCVAVCCNVLQNVAECCRVLQYVAVYCSVGL